MNQRRSTGPTGQFDLPPLPSVPSRVTIAAPAQARATETHETGAVCVRVAGSKYLTLRYLLAAALAEGESMVRNPALSDDTAVLVRCLRSLGADIGWERDGAGDTWALRVRGTGGRLATPPGGVLQVGNAGAVLRMLLALGATLPEVRFETDHPDSLGRRPNADLLAALRQLGVVVEARGPEGLLPITLRGGKLRGGEVSVSGARSSQFVSALLFLAPLVADGLTIHVVDGVVSAPFIETTRAVLGRAGITVAANQATPNEALVLRVAPGQSYHTRHYLVSGDAPSAAALIAAGVALRRPLRLLGLHPDDAEVRPLLAAVDQMGVVSRWVGDDDGPALVLAHDAGDSLFGAVIDGDSVIDSVPVLAALAAFARGTTQFARVAHLRLKESDRLGDLATEFARVGAHATDTGDVLTIQGDPTGVRGGAEVHGHDDHRLVEALAVLACRSAAPITVVGAGAVAKSYPRFFADLAALGAPIEPS